MVIVNLQYTKNRSEKVFGRLEDNVTALEIRILLGTGLVINKAIGNQSVSLLEGPDFIM